MCNQMLTSLNKKKLKSWMKEKVDSVLKSSVLSR